LKSIARGHILQPLNERRALDGDGVADLQGRETGHDLAGAPLPDPEEFLNGEPVQVRDFHTSQFR
jgi:hypothetical protein